MAFRIKNREIGPGYPAYIIAEMSANHAGSLEHAKEIIWAAKEAGADCIKIQTYTADTLTLDCDNEYFKIKSGPWQGEETMYNLYGKANTPWEWHKELKEEAEKAVAACKYPTQGVRGVAPSPRAPGWNMNSTLYGSSSFTAQR